VLFFHSSDKESLQPTIDRLAQRLASKGVRCAVAWSSRRLRLWEPDPSAREGYRMTPIEGFQTRMGYPTSRGEGWWLVAGALIASVVLLTLLRRRVPEAGDALARDPERVWMGLTTSALRRRAWERVLRMMRPKVIVSNGAHAAVAAELLLARSARSAHRVTLYNELPFPLHAVPSLADEMWVWNQTVADSVSSLLKDGDRPRFTVTGSCEVGVAMSWHEAPSMAARALRDAAAGRPVLVYLSSYSGAKGGSSVEAEQTASRWLAEAARGHPEWYIVVKTRPFRHREDLPGQELLRGLDNVVFSRGDVSYREFLTWDDVLVVGSYYSVGLYVAAGLGKRAVRFHLFKETIRFSLLDQVCVNVSSADELVDQLRGTAESLDRKDETLESCGNDSFPFRRSALDQMERRCLAALMGHRNMSGRRGEDDSSVPRNEGTVTLMIA